jgi:UDP-N-acetylglucosamine diphosphorylase / glucose-1-phosphate thymidylyltransferase / UDP-N-acetylgalactosamine diphosphorylase / glucosamine-1-phosphate N-acetyltransferase / galactosamine-1-phosphate N-acetyltransferase
MLKAVILAAGNGVRTQPLTLTRPKPLLKVLDRTIIEHNLSQLRGLVKEAIIVIGYKGDMIKTLLGDKHQGIKIRYVIQEERLGTGDAARKASVFLDDKFLLLNGDDLYFHNDIKQCLKKYPTILLGRVSDPSCFGVVEHHKGFVKNIMEKPERFPLNALVNTGLYYLSKSVFDSRIEKSPRGEYEFTDYVRGFILNERLRYREADKWIPVSYPWNLLEANEFLLEGLRRDVRGTVEKNCNIKGAVFIEKRALIKSGTYIEGPVYIKKNAVIGPNAFIRGKTVIGDNSKVGNGVEVKNSFIGDNVKIAHLSYVGDSVIDDNSNLGAGVILANQRFDSQNVKVSVRGKKIDTNRSKFGSVIGENVNIGINSSLMPGVMISSGTTIFPNSLVKDNLKNDEE